MKRESQNQQILNWLKAGNSITSAQAFYLFGCLRLSARIADLRARGYLIESTMITLPNKKRVARYSLETLD